MRINKLNLSLAFQIFFVFIFFSAIFLSSPKLTNTNAVHATTAIIKPLEENGFDAQIDYDTPDQNQGQGSGSWSQYGDRSTGTYAGGPYRTLWKFDVSSIPMGATITSASFTIYMSDFDYDDDWPAMKLYRITSDWTETGVTWNNQPSYDGTIIASYTPPTYRTATAVTQDITTTVAGWISGTYTNYGVIGISESEATQWSRVNVSTSKSTGIEPYLTIVYSSSNVCSRAPDGSNQVTINSACSFSNFGANGSPKVDGIDVVGANSTNAAILRIAPGGSLTVKANQTLNVGSIKIDKGGSSGTISIIGNGSEKGSIKIRQPVYVNDVDGDNYGNLQDMASTAGGNYVRLASLTSRDLGDVSSTFACALNTSYTTCKKCTQGTSANVAAGKATFSGNEVTPSSNATSCDGTSHIVSTVGACSASSRWAACDANGTCDTAATSNYATIGTVNAAAGYAYSDTVGNTNTTTNPGSTCQKCNGSGSLVSQASNEDLYNQCTLTYTGCSGACTKTGIGNTCSGTGASCIAASANMTTAGKVCSGGSEVNPTDTNNCDYRRDCVTGACSYITYARGCTAGSTSCTDTSRINYGTTYPPAGNAISQTLYSTSACTYNTTTKPSAAGTCQKCNGSGGIMNQTNAEDLYSECNLTYNACTNACVKSGVGANCSGSGASCGAASANVALNKVCSGGVEYTPSAGTNCGTGYTYANYNCYAQSYYMGCNGSGSCTSNTTAGSVYYAALDTYYTGSGLTTTTGNCRSASCSIARCTGCTCTYRCGGAGNCDHLNSASCTRCSEY